MTELRYRSWRIYPNDFIAHPDAWKVAWCASHQDFDGAEDARDGRCFCFATVEDLKAEIDEWELTHPERVYDRTWVPCTTCEDGCVPDGPLDGTEKLTFCPDCHGYAGWFEGPLGGEDDA